MAYHPEDFVRAVESIRPVKNRTDFEAVNHGDGPVIGAWFREDVTQPTQEEIEAVDTDALPPPLPAPTPADQVLYDHENRLRAIEGEPPLTLGEFLGREYSDGI